MFRARRDLRHVLLRRRDRTRHRDLADTTFQHRRTTDNVEPLSVLQVRTPVGMRLFLHRRIDTMEPLVVRRVNLHRRTLVDTTFQHRRITDNVEPTPSAVTTQLPQDLCRRHVPHRRKEDTVEPLAVRRLQQLQQDRAQSTHVPTPSHTDNVEPTPSVDDRSWHSADFYVDRVTAQWHCRSVVCPLCRSRHHRTLVDSTFHPSHSRPWNPTVRRDRTKAPQDPCRPPAQCRRRNQAPDYRHHHEDLHRMKGIVVPCGRPRVL